MNKFTVGVVSFVPFPTSGRASLALFTSSFHHPFPLFKRSVPLKTVIVVIQKFLTIAVTRFRACLDSEERKTEDRDFRFFENTRMRLL